MVRILGLQPGNRGSNPLCPMFINSVATATERKCTVNRKLLLGISVLIMLVLACGSSPTPSSGALTMVPSTPVVVAPMLFTARAIELRRDELTDLQFDAYRLGILGNEIHFVGTVREVYPDGRVLIKFSSTKRMLTLGHLLGIPVEQAIKINQDQLIRGTGHVNDVTEFLGLSIDIDVNALQ